MCVGGDSAISRRRGLGVTVRNGHGEGEGRGVGGMDELAPANDGQRIWGGYMDGDSPCSLVPPLTT